MALHVTYSKARAKLASIWDRVEESGEVVFLHRRGHRTVALIDADELESLRETAHLLRSPKNALRLLTALKRSLDETVEPLTVRELRAELGVESGGDEFR
jgi:antitoxin YefM